MACKVKTDIGCVTINDEVISMLAGNAAMESYGIVAMASKRASDPLVELFGRENISRGVKVVSEDDTVYIQVFTIMEYGVSISAVAQSAMEAIKYTVENTTGLRVGSVDIIVESIRV